MTAHSEEKRDKTITVKVAASQIQDWRDAMNKSGHSTLSEYIRHTMDIVSYAISTVETENEKTVCFGIIDKDNPYEERDIVREMEENKR